MANAFFKMSLDRFHLAADVIDRVAKITNIAAYMKQFVRDRLIEHREYITNHGQDMLEILKWKWSGAQ